MRHKKQTVFHKSKRIVLFKIYTLSNPSNGQVFYVGHTRKRLAERLSVHRSKAMTTLHDCPVYRYIRRMEHRPLIELVEEVECVHVNEARKVELFWYNMLKYWGFDIVNAAKPYDVNNKYQARY